MVVPGCYCIGNWNPQPGKTTPETWIQRAAQSLHKQALVDYAQDFTHFSILLFPQSEPFIILNLPVIPVSRPVLHQYRSQFHSVLQVQLYVLLIYNRAAQSLHKQALVDYAQDFTHYSILLFYYFFVTITVNLCIYSNCNKKIARIIILC